MRKGRQDPDGQIAENKKSDLAEVPSGVLQRTEGLRWNYLKPGFILSEERKNSHYSA